MGTVDTSEAQYVPLVVGVTGHRDLVGAELGQIRERVRSFLAGLMKQFPDLPLMVMTPLAEGADRLVAEVAVEFDIPVVILLPMPQSVYQTDFSGQSLDEFRSMTELGEIVELPLVGSNTLQSVAVSGNARDLQYAQLGAYLAAHSHILLALWDGKQNQAPGGTAHVVQFHQHDVIELIAEGQHRSPIDFAEDESDLVYHIICSRREDGAPADGLRAGNAHWLTRDDVNPRTDEMPEGYAVVFGRMAEFNRDLAQPVDMSASYPLVSEASAAGVGEALSCIDSLFHPADLLAARFQRRAHRALLVSHTLAVLAGLSFIVWADLPEQDYMIYPYLIFIALTLLVFDAERRGGWQRKSLDYRVLAEGLRVQFYWALAGVKMANPSRFSHDSFLRQQDLELGWIRNVMRYAGRQADAALAEPEPANSDLAVREWVAGQMAWYQSASRDRSVRNRLTSTLLLATFLTGLAVAAGLAVFQYQLQAPWSNLLVALMGLLPIIAAVRQNYAHRTAERELVTQYGYQLRIFSNAHRLLERTENLARRREILLALGESALEEHGQWIMRQRERPLAGQVLQPS
jgi:hypothetical protein